MVIISGVLLCESLNDHGFKLFAYMISLNNYIGEILNEFDIRVFGKSNCRFYIFFKIAMYLGRKPIAID